LRESEREQREIESAIREYKQITDEFITLEGSRTKYIFRSFEIDTVLGTGKQNHFSIVYKRLLQQRHAERNKLASR